MTAQLLVSELSTLLQESKRKNPDLRAFAGNGIAGLQRLIVSNALPQNTLADILDAIRDCATLGLDIQLKVLQALPSLLQNYATSLTGSLLISAFQVSFLLYGNKTAVVSNTAAATLQQLVNSTLEKAAAGQNAASESNLASEVSIGNETVFIQGVLLDAYRTFDDLCLLTQGQKPKHIQGAFLSQNFGLELIHSVLLNHIDIILARPELVHVVRTRLMPLIIEILSDKAPFPTTVRAMRLVQLIISRLLLSLVSECEIALSLLNHMLDPDAAPAWKRAICLEVYRNLHADLSLIRSIYVQFDNAEGKRNIIRDHLGSLVHLASERPNIIGLGHQSSIPLVATDDSSEQAALQAGGLVGSIGAAVTTMSLDTPGISNRWSTIKTACIEQLDKSEAPALPATYIYSLVLTCLTIFEEGLARFLLPFTAHVEEKAKRRQVKTTTEETMISPEDNGTQQEQLLEARATRSRKVPVNPLSLMDHPVYSQICTSAHMVDQCWPALLAASSTFLNASLDSENFRILVRSFQKFTQTAGVLNLSTPRDAFLTTLGKHALPSTIFSKGIKTASTPALNGQQFPEVDSMTGSSRDASPAQSKPSTKQNQSIEMAAPVMNSRHLLCLRALLNLGIALGPVLEKSWTIIIETLQQADLLLTARGSAERRQRKSKRRRDDSVSSEDLGNVEDLSLEITAVEAAASRLFESTNELTDEAFTDHLECLCRLLRDDPLMDQSQKMPSAMLSPSMGGRKRPKVRSVLDTSAESSTASHENAFVLEKLRIIIKCNITRLMQTETEHNGWALLVTTLMDALSSTEMPPTLRTAAANTLDGMLVLVAVFRDFPTEDMSQIVRARSLSSLLYQITILYQSSGQPSRSSQQCELEIHGLALEALRAILEQCGDTLSQGWNEVFAVILSAFERTHGEEPDPPSYTVPNVQARSSTLVRSSFGSLQLICSDFLSSLPHSSLPQLLDTLYCFSAQDHDLNISLTTATFFRTTSEYLLRESEDIGLDSISSGKDSNGLPDTLPAMLLEDASTPSLWLMLLLQLVKLTRDRRAEVRHSASHTIFRIVDAHGDLVSPSSLPRLFGSVMKPILSINVEMHAQAYDHPDKDGNFALIDEWNDTAVVVIEGLSKLFSQWLDTPKFRGELFAMLCDLLEQLQTYLERRVLAISKTVFRGISDMLAEVEDRTHMESVPILSIWQLWIGHNPASHRSTSQKGSDNNHALLAYLYCLGQLLRLGGQTLGLDIIKSTLEQLQASVAQATALAYSTDVDTLTPVQKAVLDSLKMIPVTVQGADRLVVDTLSSLVTMAYRQDIPNSESQHSYIALSKASIALLVPFLNDRVKQIGYPDSLLVTALLSALDIPLHLKYKWRRDGRDQPPWKKATSTAVEIFQLSKPIMTGPNPAEFSFWEGAVSIIDGIVAADCSAIVDEDKIQDDEAFDIEAFSTLRGLIIPSLGLKSIPELIRRRFCQSLLKNSLIHEPHVDDLAWPGEDLLDGLDRDHFGRVNRLPPSARSKMSYMLLDELFDLVAVHDGSPERVRLSQAAGPYLILRTGLTLKTYILDQPLRGRMPQPPSQKDEMLYVLKKLVELRSVPEAIPASTKITSGNKGHLYRLYSLILRALKAAWRDEVMTNALREVLEAVGDDFEA
ncbi:MAG: hypothetical protein Q9163_004352 [Psora crenata]